MRLQPSRATEITGMISRLNSRQLPPKPWVDGSVLPWGDTEFSELFASRVDYHAQYGFPTAEEDADVLWRELALGPGHCVLDLACGPGRHTIELARRGLRMTGVDIGPGAVSLATRRATEAGVSAEFHLHDVLELEYEAEFDGAFIISGQVGGFQPHELGSLLSGVYRALRPGGRFVMEFPDASTAEADTKVGSSWSIWKGEWSIFGKEDHLVLQEVFYDADQVASMERSYIVGPDGSMREVTTCTQYYHPHAVDDALLGVGLTPIGLGPGVNNWKRAIAVKPGPPTVRC